MEYSPHDMQISDVGSFMSVDFVVSKHLPPTHKVILSFCHYWSIFISVLIPSMAWHISGGYNEVSFFSGCWSLMARFGIDLSGVSISRTGVFILVSGASVFSSHI